MTVEGEIIPEMEVYGSDNVHVGGVERVEHARIVLNTVASSIPVEGDLNHYVLLADVARVEVNRVHLSVPGVEAVHPRPGASANPENRETINSGAALNRTGTPT